MKSIKKCWVADTWLGLLRSLGGLGGDLEARRRLEGWEATWRLEGDLEVGRQLGSWKATCRLQGDFEAERCLGGWKATWKLNLLQNIMKSFFNH